MKNLHEINREISDREWALARWMSTSYLVKVIDDIMMYKLRSSPNWSTNLWTKESWEVVIGEWKDAKSPKTAAMRKRIILGD
jgi:hypothetical protein